jgi:hypothetical protein
LDDPRTRDHHVFATKLPIAGQVLYLNHDSDTRIVFESLAGFAEAAERDYEVSHETIYRSLYLQTRGALKKELLEHLRRSRTMRRSRRHTLKTDDHGRTCDHAGPSWPNPRLSRNEDSNEGRACAGGRG